MTTIYDIAKLACVSHSTVSRVLNNSGYVKGSTRERVLKAADELGYIPNDLAKGLANRRTHTIAVIVSDVTNPFFTTAVRGVEDIAIANGYNVILCNTDEDIEKERLYIDLVLRKQVEGVILASAAGDATHLDIALKAEVPIVLLDRRIKGAKLDVVRGDSYRGAKAAVEHLVFLGHERIALISGPLYLDCMAERLNGYRDALNEAGIGFDASLIQEGVPKAQSGEVMATSVMLGEVPPTAIVCASNFLGFGTAEALWHMNINPCRDVAIIPFDYGVKPPYSSDIPFVASVNQPAYQLGAMSMEAMLKRINGSGTGESPSEAVLPVVLDIF